MQAGRYQSPQNHDPSNHEVELSRNEGNADDSELPGCLQQGHVAELHTAYPSQILPLLTQRAESALLSLMLEARAIVQRRSWHSCRWYCGICDVLLPDRTVLHLCSAMKDVADVVGCLQSGLEHWEIISHMI